MRNKIRLALSMALTLMLLCGCGHDTLQDAVQSNWQTPITVLNVDETNHVMIYQDHSQYIFGRYEVRDGKYSYDNTHSSGWRASSDIGIPFLVQTNSNDEYHFVWGALYTDIPARRISIRYAHGETQEVMAVNNTFIARIPGMRGAIDPMLLMPMLDKVTAYDKMGKALVEWQN